MLLALLLLFAHAEDAVTDAILDVPHTEVEVKKQVVPDYPESAEALRLPAATCTAQVTLDTAGAPTDVKVAVCPRPFAVEAEKALMQWRWHPAELRGEPVRVRFYLTVRFAIEGAPPEAASSRQTWVPDPVTMDTVRGNGPKSYFPVDYPPGAVEKGIQGDCHQRVYVNAKGRVELVENIACNPLLGPSSAVTMRRWRWQPRVVDGKKAPQTAEVVVHYKLRAPYR